MDALENSTGSDHGGSPRDPTDQLSFLAVTSASASASSMVSNAALAAPADALQADRTARLLEAANAAIAAAAARKASSVSAAPVPSAPQQQPSSPAWDLIRQQMHELRMQVLKKQAIEMLQGNRTMAPLPSASAPAFPPPGALVSTGTSLVSPLHAKEPSSFASSSELAAALINSSVVVQPFASQVSMSGRPGSYTSPGNDRISQPPPIYSNPNRPVISTTSFRARDI
jgi:hypothetical protein